jgi:hypothetical protein
MAEEERSMQIFEENRTAYLSFVLTPTFDRQLRAFAKSRGMTVSRLVRIAVAAHMALEEAKDAAKGGANGRLTLLQE